ncbi:hypothetical protein FHW19_004607 [Ochrobactrum anthropi]|nr:hypothetical protein [Brucella anthropi]
MTSDKVAMGIVIGLSVFIELWRCIDRPGIVWPIDSATDTVATIIFIGMTVIARSVAMLVSAICDHSFNDSAENSSPYDTAYIMTVMIILACTWVKSIAATMVIAPHVGKHTRTPLRDPDIAALRIISPGAIQYTRRTRTLMNELRPGQRASVTFTILVVSGPTLYGRLSLGFDHERRRYVGS